MDGNQTIMKIGGVCVDILCEIDPIYQDYMVTKGNQKVLYVHITQAIYGMLVSAMLFYQKLTRALLSDGFELNPYDLCVVNKMVNSEQLTVAGMWMISSPAILTPKSFMSFYNGLKTCLGNSVKLK